MSSTARRRKNEQDSSSSLLNPIEKKVEVEQKTTGKNVTKEAAKVKSNRFTFKILLGMLSVVCFTIAFIPYLRNDDITAGISFEGDTTIMSEPIPPRKKKAPEFRSSMPFALTTRSLAKSPIRTADSEKQAVVKEAFQASWNAYVEDAFGADEYHPISRGGTNFSTDGGVGYFIIDTLDVLLLMGEEEGYKRGRDWVREVDWGQRKGKFSVFETTIRTLGGLLSAHALCTPGADTLSPRTSALCDPGDAQLFLNKAVLLAERLKPAFEQNRLGIPLREVDFHTGEAFADTDNYNLSSLAEVASIQLEFKYLAQITEDDKWWTLAEKPMKAVVAGARRSKSEGLLPIFLSPNTGDFFMTSIRLGSRGDSYYEYLLKQYIQTNHSEPIYGALYNQATESIKRRLLYQSLTNKLLFTTEIEPRRNPMNGQTSFFAISKQDHLVCFIGGSYMLGAIHMPKGFVRSTIGSQDEDEESDKSSRTAIYPLNTIEDLSPASQEDWNVGHELIRTCVDTYTGTSTGLGPEIAIFRLPNDSYTGLEQDWYIKNGKQKKGIYEPLIDARNILRPETVESLFIAFHLTGDEIYRQWGWQIFQSFIKSTRIKEGEKGRVGAFSSIRDVQAKEGSIEREDRMETFWLAETLKYLYLLFSDQDTLRLDQWVLNTEAHPLPIFQPIFKTTVV